MFLPNWVIGDSLCISTQSARKGACAQGISLRSIRLSYLPPPFPCPQGFFLAGDQSELQNKVEYTILPNGNLLGFLVQHRLMTPYKRSANA